MIDVYEKLEFRGKCYRLWIYVCNADEYDNLQKLHTVVYNKVDACDKVKYSDDCLRKVVLKQQLVAKQSEFIRSYFRDLWLGCEEDEVERGRFDDGNCGDYGVNSSCDAVNSGFVGSSDTNKVEFGCNDDDCMEGMSYVDLVDSRRLNLMDTEDYKCNDDNCMESRSYVDMVLLSTSHSQPLNSKDMVDYKCGDDNFVESRSYADSVPLTASHSPLSILKDGTAGVEITESDRSMVW